MLVSLPCSDCPELLAPHVARSVYVHVSKLDLSKFSVSDDGHTEDDEDRGTRSEEAQQTSNLENPKPQIPRKYMYLKLF